MKNNIYKFFLTLFLIIFITSFTSIIKFNSFSSLNVLNIVKDLTSDKYEGRLVGTDGNTKTCDYIKSYMMKNNISPFKENYLHSFDVAAPIKDDTDPLFEVFDKNNTKVYSFKYGKDYKESFFTFNDTDFNFSYKDKINYTPDTIRILKNDGTYLFYVTDNINLRSSYSKKSNIKSFVYITEETHKKIINFKNKGYSLKFHTPYKVHNIQAFNVISCIDGWDKTLPPLVLSCHFDHMGKDLNGKIYRGALDNASGTAFLLELSKYLNTLAKPKRDIIIASFNAEEFECLGSSHFVCQNKDLLKGAIDINFDMIGSSKKLPLSFLTNSTLEKRSNSFISSLEDSSIKNSLSYNISENDCSDHISFLENNLDAVTISNYDTARIHSFDDTVNFLDAKSIDDLFLVMRDFILNYSYSNHSFIMFNKLYCILSFVISLILIIIPYPKNNLKNKKPLSLLKTNFH